LSDAQAEQIAINLERWRWMPDDFGARHLLVNIPTFDLRAREEGRTVLGMRVVTGKVENRTPVFSGEMETVVFSPYWNVPSGIAANETVPAIANDFTYLERNNMEILKRTKSGATAVDPTDVDWSNAAEVRQLAFRQAPGRGNALGGVKFLFPNPHDVYLHDTPADKLFARPVRALSHGCVRLAEPEVLASYVLRDDPAWTKERIAAAMVSGSERHVKLSTKIPVHIVYFTTPVDDTGTIQFAPDIYRYDAKQRTFAQLGREDS
jgi:L,D-transpeptidase YcbB